MAKTYGWTLDYILSLDHYVVWRLAEEIQGDAWDGHVLNVSSVYDGVVRAVGPMFIKDMDLPPLLMWHQKLYPRSVQGALPTGVEQAWRRFTGLDSSNQQG